jgi:hypothetical protein
MRVSTGLTRARDLNRQPLGLDDPIPGSQRPNWYALSPGSPIHYPVDHSRSARFHRTRITADQTPSSVLLVANPWQLQLHRMAENGSGCRMTFVMFETISASVISGRALIFFHSGLFPNARQSFSRSAKSS